MKKILVGVGIAIALVVIGVVAELYLAPALYALCPGPP